MASTSVIVTSSFASVVGGVVWERAILTYEDEVRMVTLTVPFVERAGTVVSEVTSFLVSQKEIPLLNEMPQGME